MYALFTPWVGPIILKHPGWDPYPFGWLVSNSTGGQGFEALPPNLIPCLIFNTINMFILLFIGFIGLFMASLVLQVLQKVLESNDRIVARIKLDKQENSAQIFAYITKTMKEMQDENIARLEMEKKNN